MALRQKQHDLKGEATGLLDAADKESRDLTEAETKRFTEIEAELTKVDADIKAAEAMDARRARMGALVTAPSQIRVPAAAFSDQSVDKTGGWKDIAEFAVAVRRACVPEGRHNIDPRLFGVGPDGRPKAAPTGYMEGGGSSGEGFELPIAFRDGIWDLVFENEGLINRVDLEPTSARQVQYNADQTTPWGSTGITAAWRVEGAQMSATKLVTKSRTMDLHELYAFVLATEELLEDSPRLANRITEKSAAAISWKIDDAVVWGTGAGMPLGWMNGGSLVTVAKESAQAADTLDDQNVLKMYARLLVAPGDRPVWFANRDVLPQLAVMVVGDTPIWLPPRGVAEAPNGTLLGLPVVWSEHAKTIGDLGDIMLVSPKGYYAARRTAGINFAASMHLFFDYNVQAFRWTIRIGGQPHLSAAISPANGSNTRSHFVALAERA